MDCSGTTLKSKIILLELDLILVDIIPLLAIRFHSVKAFIWLHSSLKLQGKNMLLSTLTKEVRDG